jgi:hypothetical protein
MKPLSVSMEGASFQDVVKKLYTFYGTKIFVAVFTRPCHTPEECSPQAHILFLT